MLITDCAVWFIVRMVWPSRVREDRRTRRARSREKGIYLAALLACSALSSDGQAAAEPKSHVDNGGEERAAKICRCVRHDRVLSELLAGSDGLETARAARVAVMRCLLWVEGEPVPQIVEAASLGVDMLQRHMNQFLVEKRRSEFTHLRGGQMSREEYEAREAIRLRFTGWEASVAAEEDEVCRLIEMPAGVQRIVDSTEAMDAQSKRWQAAVKELKRTFEDLESSSKRGLQEEIRYGLSGLCEDWASGSRTM